MTGVEYRRVGVGSGWARMRHGPCCKCLMRRDVVVIGGSAGAVETLRTVVSGLPADVPAAVMIVRATSEPIPDVQPNRPTLVEAEAAMDVRQVDDADLLESLGQRSMLSCPDCQGALWTPGRRPAVPLPYRARLQPRHAPLAEDARTGGRAVGGHPWIRGEHSHRRQHRPPAVG
jgi:hypothetical protein